MEEDIKPKDQPLELEPTEVGETTELNEEALEGVAGGNPLILAPGAEDEAAAMLACGCGSANGAGAGGECICGSENGSGA